MRALSLVALILLSASALASETDSGHLISTAGGIASPSKTSAIQENPAGLAYNNGLSLFGDVASSNDSFDPLGFGGLVFFGNGFAGGGIGLQDYNGNGVNGGNLVVLDLGIAAIATKLNLAFGVSSTYVISNSTGVSLNSLDMNVGAIFNPLGDFRLGATLFDVTHNIDAFGGGMSYDLSHDAIFGLDGAADRVGGGKTLKPALTVHENSVQATVGYGISLENGGSSAIATGAAFGLGLKVTENAHLQFYYNQLAKYFFGLTYRL